ncbi:MAG: sel1 repeat family protein [Deltaproteobacteria bacterium]|jgi:TPR repeat protein|nr:sel1 repeat family protein [Deltaproteobacteria bacterium]
MRKSKQPIYNPQTLGLVMTIEVDARDRSNSPPIEIDVMELLKRAPIKINAMDLLKGAPIKINALDLLKSAPTEIDPVALVKSAPTDQSLLFKETPPSVRVEKDGSRSLILHSRSGRPDPPELYPFIDQNINLEEFKVHVVDTRGPFYQQLPGFYIVSPIDGARYRAEAVKGDPEAQYNYGLSHYKSPASPKEVGQTAHWLYKAACQGHAEARLKLASFYRANLLEGFEETSDHGSRVKNLEMEKREAQEEFERLGFFPPQIPRHLIDSVVWYKLAADLGSLEAHFTLGLMFRRGEILVQNTKEALKSLVLAKDVAKGEAFYNLGDMYATWHDAPRSYKKAAHYFSMAYQLSHPLGSLKLGLMYYHGQGLEKNYGEAIKCLELSAELGCLQAMTELGEIYLKGTGGPLNYEAAFKWYGKAAQSSPKAKAALGYMYQNGLGVTRDYQEAIRLYREAADKRNAEAALNLGEIYYNAIGVPRNEVEAFKWFRLAADLGLAKAQDFVGVMFSKGEGTI